MRRRFHLVFALLFSALAATASHLAAEAAAAEEPAPAVKVLRVATSGDYAPFSVATDDAATFTGFDIDLASAFARDRGYRIEYLRFRWPELGRLLAAGAFDVAMSGVTVKAERSLAGRYSVPVAASSAVALAWKGSGAATLAELDRAGRRVAVNAGGHLESVARGVFTKAEVVAIADNDAVRMALLDRTFDAVVSDNYEARVWRASARDVVAIGPLSEDRKALLLPAGRDTLEAELDLWLLAREKDGTLATLRRRHLTGESEAGTASDPAGVTTAEPVAALAAAIAERLALMPMVYEAKREAGKAIEDKVQEAAVLDAGLTALASAAAAAGKKAPADVDAARALFEILIAMGKDVQQGLADQAARAEAPVAEDPARTKPETAPIPVKASPVRPRLHDLATELRPAISRITEKIARIVVAMEEAVTAQETKQRLASVLGPRLCSAERLDALATAVARLSSQSPSK